MENHCCEEALDCLFSIYKASPPSLTFLPVHLTFRYPGFPEDFIANIATQVIERHIVRGLEKIFSPVTVNNLSKSESQVVALKTSLVKRHREFLEDRIGKLKDGYQVLRDVISIAVS